jgi:peroxiredoxin Q/BCP
LICEEVLMSRMMREMTAVLGAGLVLAGMTANLAAEEPKVGDKAPAFSLQGSDGKTHALSDYKGKSAAVVAWFPKAFTGGCTKECKSFAQQGKALKGLNVAYFTASVDEPDYNKRFAESLSCDYPILSDPSKDVAKSYGVVHEGRDVPERWTFYIDKEGIIRAIDKKVNVENAATDAAAKLKDLGIAEK